MILEEYNKKINESASPKQTAKYIACMLNRDDPFNVYIIEIELVSKKFFIEKQAIKGMK